LGYQAGVKGYRLWCPETSKFLISRDVTFDENFMVKGSKQVKDAFEEPRVPKQV
jgi:hypothetical protein